MVESHPSPWPSPTGRGNMLPHRMRRLLIKKQRWRLVPRQRANEPSNKYVVEKGDLYKKSAQFFGPRDKALSDRCLQMQKSFL